MTTWDLAKLKVSVLDGSVVPILRWQNLYLSESPLVLTLVAGPLKEFTETINANSVDPLAPNLRDFLKLYEDIKNNGIRNTSTIRIGEDYEIVDGHHRLAILLALGEKEITLPDDQTVKK
jgi:hypothetical protein